MRPLGAEETVAYSALAVSANGEVRPLLVIREVGTYEWWGDTCEYVDGSWRELQASPAWSAAEEYVAAPLSNDPSFHGRIPPRSAAGRVRAMARSAARIAARCTMTWGASPSLEATTESAPECRSVSAGPSCVSAAREPRCSASARPAKAS